MSKKPVGEGVKIITQNRKARFNYHIIETYEAGLVLSGSEVKSIKAGGVSIEESYVRPGRGEMFLLGAHIRQYSFNADPTYDPIKPRKLLLNKSEILKLTGKVSEKGLTIVPLQIHLKRGRIKLEIGLAKAKLAPDKRQSIKESEAKREMARVTKGKMR